MRTRTVAPLAVLGGNMERRHGVVVANVDSAISVIFVALA